MAVLGLCFRVRSGGLDLPLPIPVPATSKPEHKVSSVNTMNNSPQSLLSLIVARRWWIILPTIFMTTAAIGYALMKPDYWDATQALYVRDEVVATGGKLGSFVSTDAMQTAQETILEVALHHNTLRGALQEAGRAKSFLSFAKSDDAWPNDKDVEDFRKAVSVTAPKGAQFGRTEMIYVTVRSRNQKRSLELTNAVVNNLTERLKELRKDKYTGIIAEIEKTIQVAKAERDGSLERMTEIEQSLGSEVTDLRVLSNAAQGDGVIRREVTEIKTFLRLAKSEYEQRLHSRKQLLDAQRDPQLLIAMPNAVLDTQPALRRLKEGLVDARLKAANLTGSLSAEHPQARAATAAVQKIKNQLLTELRVAIRTLDGDLRSYEVRIANTLQQLQRAEQALAGLSDVRSEYASLEAEVQERTKFLEQARKDLSTARSNQIAATNVSLIQRVDQVVPGTRPIGPSGRSIILTGLFAGLLTGFGLVYLFPPTNDDFGRRFTDNTDGRRQQDKTQAAVATAGRRNADRTRGIFSYPFWPNGRRTADKSGTAQPAPPPRRPLRPTQPTAPKQQTPHPALQPKPQPAPPTAGPTNLTFEGKPITPVVPKSPRAGDMPPNAPSV